MKWLKRLFSSQAKSAPPSSRQTSPVRFASDESYSANEDLLDGSEFIATLHLTTPYSVLIHHGEKFGGQPSKAPQYGTQDQGMWLPKTKSWKSLGIDLPELPPLQHATDAGPQNPDAYLPFLLAFRRIFESDKSDEIKIAELQTLAAQTPEYSKFWQYHTQVREDFPHSLFYHTLLKLPGVGRKTARSLYDAGFRSVEQVQHSEPSELQKVPGIGPVLAKKLVSRPAW